MNDNYFKIAYKIPYDLSLIKLIVVSISQRGKRSYDVKLLDVKTKIESSDIWDIEYLTKFEKTWFDEKRGIAINEPSTNKSLELLSIASDIGRAEATSEKDIEENYPLQIRALSLNRIRISSHMF